MLDLAKLYDLHSAALYAFLRQLTQSEADAQDLLQGVFVRLAQNATRGESTLRNERSFLLTVAHRLFLDSLRRQDSRLRTLRAFETQSALFHGTPAESPFDAESLEAALSPLPPEQRAVVHLKIWEGQTLEEISTLLEIPVPTATSRYRYALQKLRKHLTTPTPGVETPPLRQATNQPTP